MGSEVILPGTPTSQIPPGDRPIFDPSLQNGYAGLAGGGASVNGQTPIGVTKQTVYLRAALATINPPSGLTAFGSVSVPAGGQANYPIGSLLGVPDDINGTVTVQATGAVTSGAVFIGQGGDSINVTKAPGGTVQVYTGLRVNNGGFYNGIQILNTDAAAQTVGLSFTPDLDYLFAAYPYAAVYDFATGAGAQFALGPNDILRIRELHLQAWPGTGPSGAVWYFPPEADLRIESGPPILPGWTQNFPVVTHRRMRGRRLYGSSQNGGDVYGANVMIWSLEEPLVIAGSDAIIGGQVNSGGNWSPRVWINYSVASNNSILPVIAGIFEIFRNANS
jgi:hypothetical protein